MGVKRALPVLLVIGTIVLLMGLLFSQPTGSDRPENSLEVKAVVLKTDNSCVTQNGILRIGEQALTIRITEGKYKGEVIEAGNNMIGEIELDNFYEPGDRMIAAILVEDGQITAARAIDLYRQGWQAFLFVLFIILLVIYARFTGLKALLSFIASLYIIWTILIPGLLAGQSPMLLTTAVLTLLTGVIVFSVAGFTKKGLSAFVGTISGLTVTIVLTLAIGDRMNLTGLTAPFAQTLLYSGHLELNMLHILYAAIIIGASGAAMDIAMDVAASMEEIKIKKPSIKAAELIKSGFNVGRTVIGTMATTLLLAYSGGYLTLLMLFMTKDTSLMRIINLQIVAAEITRTLIGSIGLVLVAPITAVFAGYILCGWPRR